MENPQRKGKKVCVVNVPMTYAPEQVNGVLVSGMMTPSVESPFTYPDDLRHEVLERSPDYDLTIPRQSISDLLEISWMFEKFASGCERLIETRAAVANWLMDEYDWDFFMVHFYFLLCI